jgi:hypothetical protein
LHLALFSSGKYYELAKRLLKITYKYEFGQEGQHGINYLRPGRIIMFTIVVQAILFAFKVIKTIYGSYQMYKKTIEKKKGILKPQEQIKSNP